MTQPLPQLTHLGLDTIEVLGEGGMGVVYRVRDRRLGRDAALKLIRNESGIDPRAINRFRREVLVTAKLDHPAIPPVYDSGTDPQGRPYMLMRVVEGRPLSDIVKAHHDDYGGEMARRELLEALVKVCEAIAYAHTQGIVHRDLKPANVMVGRFGEVLVMDWGLARELGKTAAEDAEMREEVAGSAADEAQETGQTLQGAVVGTPGYMPPEQAEGVAVDERADIFALGAMLCCILTGGPPVRGATSVNRLVATLKGQVSMPSELAPGVPGELNAIAAKALATEPGDRTPTVQHFLRDLRAYLAGQEVRAYAYSLRERSLRWMRGNVAMLVVAFTILLFGVGVAGAAAVTLQIQREARAQQLASAKEAAHQKQLAETRAKEKDRTERALRLLNEADDLARRSGSTGEIEQRVREALELVPDRYTRNHAARILERAGLLEQAVELLETCVKLHEPAYRELFALHELTVRREGRLPEQGGTEPLRRLRDLALEHGDTDNEYVLFTRAQDAFAAKRYDEARALYTKAIRRYPRFVWALSNRATLRLMAGDPKGCLKDAERAVKIDPTFAPALANMAVAHMQLGNFPRALECIGLALSIQPKLARGYALRAQLLLRMNPKSKDARAEARSLIDQALRMNPDDAHSLGLRGTLLSDAGEYRAALRDLERSIRLEPSFEAIANRGGVLAKLGRMKEAEQDLVKALEMVPPARAAERAAIERYLKAVRSKRGR